MKKATIEDISAKKDHLGRWIVEVPKSITGTRQRFYYPDHSEALRGAFDVVMRLKTGVSSVTPESGKSLAYYSARFLQEKECKVGHHTMRQLRWALNILCDKFGDVPPERITPEIVDSWISCLKFSTRGRFNVFAVCRTFYNCRMVKQRCPVNPFDSAPPKKDKGHRLAILTPDQMRVLLVADLPEWFRAWVICGGFAGLRTEEQHRLSYPAFDFEFSEIVVKKEQSKQGEAARPRSITMQDAFKRHFKKGEGMLLQGKHPSDFSVEMPKAIKAIGLKAWPKNCLRHSFASYHLAHFREPSKTAYEMGHVSSNMIYSTYANSVTRAEAQEWWSL